MRTARGKRFSSSETFLKSTSTFKMKAKEIIFVCAILFVAQAFAFSLWPQPVVVDRPEAIPEDREGFVGRFFRWLGFIRPPIFGFSSYNHIDLGEPGEFKKDFEIRLGPKPNVNFEPAEEQQYATQPLRPPAWENVVV